MKGILILWISAIFLQEVLASTLIRVPRDDSHKRSSVRTEYIAQYEQKGKHGNESSSTVKGNQEIIHNGCGDNWNEFAEKCAALIKNLIASLANSVSSRPGDATNLHLHIKNSFKHFDSTHNCSCFNQTGRGLSDLDLDSFLNNATSKSLEPMVNLKEFNSNKCTIEEDLPNTNKEFKERKNDISDSKHPSSNSLIDKNQPLHYLSNKEINPENTWSHEPTNNNRRQVNYTRPHLEGVSKVNTLADEPVTFKNIPSQQINDEKKPIDYSSLDPIHSTPCEKNFSSTPHSPISSPLFPPNIPVTEITQVSPNPTFNLQKPLKPTENILDNLAQPSEIGETDPNESVLDPLKPIQKSNTPGFDKILDFITPTISFPLPSSEFQPVTNTSDRTLDNSFQAISDVNNYPKHSLPNTDTQPTFGSNPTPSLPLTLPDNSSSIHLFPSSKHINRNKPLPEQQSNLFNNEENKSSSTVTDLPSSYSFFNSKTTIPTPDSLIRDNNPIFNKESGTPSENNNPEKIKPDCTPILEPISHKYIPEDLSKTTDLPFKNLPTQMIPPTSQAVLLPKESVNNNKGPILFPTLPPQSDESNTDCDNFPISSSDLGLALPQNPYPLSTIPTLPDKKNNMPLPSLKTQLKQSTDNFNEKLTNIPSFVTQSTNSYTTASVTPEISTSNHILNDEPELSLTNKPPKENNVSPSSILDSEKITENPMTTNIFYNEKEKQTFTFETQTTEPPTVLVPNLEKLKNYNSLPESANKHSLHNEEITNKPSEQECSNDEQQNSNQFTQDLRNTLTPVEQRNLPEIPSADKQEKLSFLPVPHLSYKPDDFTNNEQTTETPPDFSINFNPSNIDLTPDSDLIKTVTDSLGNPKSNTSKSSSDLQTERAGNFMKPSNSKSNPQIYNPKLPSESKIEPTLDPFSVSPKNSIQDETPKKTDFALGDENMELEDQPIHGDESTTSQKPTTFQTTSVEPTPPQINILLPPTFKPSSPPHSLTSLTTQGYRETPSPLTTQGYRNTSPTKPTVSPAYRYSKMDEDEDEDEDEDCCSCESCTEDDGSSNSQHYRITVCKDLEEARRELKAIFDKIRKKLKCGRKTPRPIVVR